MSDLYVAHLADDERPHLTACGEPWQAWQAPAGAHLKDPNVVVLGTVFLPRPGIRTSVRQCQACQRRAMEAEYLGGCG